MRHYYRRVTRGHVPLGFVILLENYKILFDKRMTPYIKKEKEEALVQLTKNFNVNTNKNLEPKQVQKKLNNMKTKIKKLIDVKRTGNRRIRLSEWQQKFYDLWNAEDNPVLQRVPGIYIQ